MSNTIPISWCLLIKHVIFAFHAHHNLLLPYNKKKACMNKTSSLKIRTLSIRNWNHAIHQSLLQILLDLLLLPRILRHAVPVDLIPTHRICLSPAEVAAVAFYGVNISAIAAFYNAHVVPAAVAVPAPEFPAVPVSDLSAGNLYDVSAAYACAFFKTQ